MVIRVISDIGRTFKKRSPIKKNIRRRRNLETIKGRRTKIIEALDTLKIRKVIRTTKIVKGT